MNKIIVLGGTGFVGRSVCEKLIARTGGADDRIVVPTRRPSRAGHIQTLPTVEIVAGDVHDEACLAQWLRDADAVVNLVGILHGSEAAFQHAHAELPRRVAEASRKAGVGRIVHLSALGAADSAPSSYLRSKAAGEAALRHAGGRTTVFRPSVVFGEHDRFMNRFASLQRVFAVMPIGGADARFQPVWVDDLASAIVRAVYEPTAGDEVVEAVGPTVYTLRELVQLAGRWSGHERPVIALPKALARLQAMMFELLPGEPMVSRDNLDSMQVASVATGLAPDLRRFGIAARAMESVMPGLLGGLDGPARLEAMRALARRN